jgi:sugar phosphate permease
VIGDQTLGRRAVNLACSQARGRLNGLYTLFFVGGGTGSALAGIAWVEAGWTLVCAVGLAFAIVALARDLIGAARRRRSAYRAKLTDDA